MVRLTLRLALITAGAILLALTAGTVWQAPWAIWLWPWPDGRLTYIFAASIIAAIASPIAWIGLSGELAAMRGGALNLALTFAGITAFLVLFYDAPPDQPLDTAVPVVCALAAVTNLAIYAASRDVPYRDARETPRPVRLSFALFAVVLIAVAAALLTQQSHVFPWPLQARSSVLIGWIFLGASVYFIHGVLVPFWANAKGQLLGFLAYDAVLLGPYFAHLEAVKSEHLPSLIVYLAVLVYSTMLAAYYLFVHPGTRLGSSAR